MKSYEISVYFTLVGLLQFLQCTNGNLSYCKQYQHVQCSMSQCRSFQMYIISHPQTSNFHVDCDIRLMNLISCSLMCSNSIPHIIFLSLIPSFSSLFFLPSIFFFTVSFPVLNHLPCVVSSSSSNVRPSGSDLRGRERWRTGFRKVLSLHLCEQHGE